MNKTELLERLEYKHLFSGHSYASISFNVSSVYGSDFAVGLAALIRKYRTIVFKYPGVDEFWYTEKQMKEDIGFSYYRRKKFFRKAIELELITVVAKGLPQRDVIKINIDNLESFLAKMVSPGQREFDFANDDEIEFGFAAAIEPSQISDDCKIPAYDIAPLAEYISQIKSDVTNKKQYAEALIQKICKNKYLGVQGDYSKYKEFVFTREILDVEKHIGRVFEHDKNLTHLNGCEFTTIDFIPDGSKTECLVAKYEGKSGDVNTAYVHYAIVERFMSTKIGEKLHPYTKEKLLRYINYHKNRVGDG